MKNLNHGKIVFLGILLFCLACVFSLLTLVDYLIEQKFLQLANDPQQVKIAEQNKIATDYQTKLAELLLASHLTKTQDVESLRDQLLALRVPAEYKELHFALVSGLDNYQSAASKTTFKAELNRFMSDFAFIAKPLQTFLLNNFN